MGGEHVNVVKLDMESVSSDQSMQMLPQLMAAVESY